MIEYQSTKLRIQLQVGSQKMKTLPRKAPLFKLSTGELHYLKPRQQVDSYTTVSGYPFLERSQLFYKRILIKALGQWR